MPTFIMLDTDIGMSKNPIKLSVKNLMISGYFDYRIRVSGNYKFPDMGNIAKRDTFTRGH